MRRRTWLSITLGLTAPLLVPVTGVTAPLSERIEGTRDQIERTDAREGVLTTELSGFDSRIESLSGRISGLLGREEELLGRLDAKRAELEQVRAELERTRAELVKLRDKLGVSEKALAARLVEIYKTDEPDAVTVVLEADGFADLLERTEFMERISAQDQRVVTRVRALKEKVAAEVARLGDLEAQVAAAVTDIIDRRNELAAAREELASARAEIQGARDQRRSALTEVRQTRVHLEGNLGSLEREQRRIERELQAAQAQEEQQAAPSESGPTTSTQAGPVERGSGGLIFPAEGPITSPFGQRDGRLHAGVDIGAPSGAPIRAADSGRVTLMETQSGYGNYTCIQHAGNLSTCYAHQSRFGTRQGASVSQGDVIGYVGDTGASSGPHLHFETRENGQPVDPMGYL